MFDAPALSYAVGNHLPIKPRLRCPVRKDQALPRMLNPDVGLQVPLLGFGRRPPAVSWRIVFVAIDPVEGHAIRAFSHVLKERTEAGLPAFADGYAAPSIVSVPLIGWLVAPGEHVPVTRIALRLRRVCRVSMTRRVDFAATGPTAELSSIGTTWRWPEEKARTAPLADSFDAFNRSTHAVIMQ